MLWKHFARVRVKSNDSQYIRPRYSLTSDILAFRRCPRQYGFYSIRGYVPSHEVQLYYGTVIHEVLDRAHHHYKGLEDPTKKGTLPTDEDIKEYFDEVESSLRARGIKAINRRLKEKAIRLLKKFNQKEGPYLYPRVIDTEYRLQGDRTSHIVEGVIDVLIDSEIKSQDPDKVEIWDYKGAKKPKKKNKEDLETYQYQMQVYAALFKLRNGVYPRRAVLYFLNELDEDGSGDPKHIVDLTEDKINTALEEFDHTAGLIQQCKLENVWIPPHPEGLSILEDTCAICDIRWSCSSYAERMGNTQPSISIMSNNKRKGRRHKT